LLALTLAAGLALASSVAAADGFTVASLLGQLAAVESAQARFTEERRMALLDEPLITEGTLSYEAPDRLIRQDLAPKAALYEIDAEGVTVVSDGQELRLALRDEPVLQASIGPLLAALAGDVARLERDFALAVQGSANDWTMTLEPKTAELQEILASITLGGQAGQIQRIDMQEDDGDEVLMRLTYAAP
jgi:outer membrane lipoprotein-sorting protein